MIDDDCFTLNLEASVGDHPSTPSVKQDLGTASSSTTELPQNETSGVNLSPKFSGLTSTKQPSDALNPEHEISTSFDNIDTAEGNIHLSMNKDNIGAFKIGHVLPENKKPLVSAATELNPSSAETTSARPTRTRRKTQKVLENESRTAKLKASKTKGKGKLTSKKVQLSVETNNGASKTAKSARTVGNQDFYIDSLSANENAISEFSDVHPKTDSDDISKVNAISRSAETAIASKPLTSPPLAEGKVGNIEKALTTPSIGGHRSEAAISPQRDVVVETPPTEKSASGKRVNAGNTKCISYN